MAEPTPSRSGSGGKRHSRVVSSSRTTLARRDTKGPLEDVDPLAPATETPRTPGAGTAEAENTPIPTTPFSPTLASVEKVEPPPPPPPPKDFGYLLRPEVYHPLSQLDLPPPFRTPSFQPPPSTPLPTLLSNHSFRSAAIAASQRLCTPPAPPPAEIFFLIYTRLACLILINHLRFAAEESKALQDVHNPIYVNENTGKNILPWELQVLVVRLQGIGYGDARRGVGGYYDLAREARAEIKSAKDAEEKEIWKERLKELGICVANALIEMGGLAAAVRHLETLRPRNGRRDDLLEGRLALLYIHLGDIDAAQHCVTSPTSPNPNTPLTPLLSIASGAYTDAITQLRALPASDITTLNLAVCLFYVGKVDETMELLEGLVERGRTFHALTFNLATVYELCSEKGRERKGELVERVAGRAGGERGTGGFKL